MERASGESEAVAMVVVVPTRTVRVVRRRRSVIIGRFWTSSVCSSIDAWALGFGLVRFLKVCGAWAGSVGVKVGEDVGSKLVTSLLTSCY